MPSCNGGVHRYISWCPENGWTGFTPENRVQLAKAFPGIDLDLECNKSDIWLRANPAKAKKKNWYTFLTNWMDRSTPSPGNRSAEYTSGNAGEKNEGGPPHFVVQLPAPDLWQEACEATYNRPPPCDWPALSDPIQRELLSVIKEADPLTIAAWSAKKKEKGGA